MLDKCVFICYSTPNYSKLTNICLSSLQEINVHNINHLTDDDDDVVVGILSGKTGFQT